MSAAPRVKLRQVTGADLPVLFRQQADPEANRMAAFTAPDPTDRTAFDERWERILRDESIDVRTVVADGEVAGSVLSYVTDGDREVSYWIGREFWGRGIASEALRRYLEDVAERPLHARVATDNLASRRVLEKCGFVVCGEARGFANARGEEIDELELILRD